MKTIHDLFKLSEKHNYYCSDSSYFSLGFDTEYENWSLFIEGMGDADLDMNLVFRWDVGLRDNGTYYMDIFIIHQRKGRFVPFHIKKVTDSDLDSILNYLTIRKENIFNLWEGI